MSRRAALDSLAFGEVQYARTLRGLCAAYAAPSGSLTAVLSAPEAGAHGATFRRASRHAAPRRAAPRHSLPARPRARPLPAATLFRTVTDMRDVSAKLSGALNAAAQVRGRATARDLVAASALARARSPALQRPRPTLLSRPAGRV
jgi:hypothetical protein